MTRYRDLISHEEMFFRNTDDSVSGGRASAEGPEGEGTENTVITGADSVMNHHLQETSFSEDVYQKYVKDDAKSVKEKPEEQRPAKSQTFYYYFF
ncbi:translationally-controlled tumor protein-like [Molossus molossus]|uniref:translationally-controlled tumor protein-like n=1 Tax=Molossus molossus TaxID=27622 RepID=UPI0017465547|nr:translationally-controlled tumor protein-like [Molossus molossus]